MSLITNHSRRLAIRGGSPLIKANFRKYNPIGQSEIEAVAEVMRSGVLSKFIGAWSPDFFGGPKVQHFERDCEKFFNVSHAITVNSWTSGLIAAVGSLDIEPGDEIITTPWTMCATATAILHWNAIPVFADIDSTTFGLNPKSVEENITPYTKAILSVDIFGQSADVDALQRIATKHGLKIISDTAQAPGSLRNGMYSGTITDIGGYSLNYHKHIHTGEGGILVTNDDNLANRMRLIRNHAEAVVGSKGEVDISNMLGHNFRLGEIEASIGIEQLKKLSDLVLTRAKAADFLTKQLSDLPGVLLPQILPGNTHVYYVYPIILDIQKIGVSRNMIVEALKAEGLEGVFGGYANVHRLPLYQKKIAYGSKGFPWVEGVCHRNIDYGVGICPIAEKLHDETFLGIEMCLFDWTENEIVLAADAFRKVWSNLDELH